MDKEAWSVSTRIILAWRCHRPPLLLQLHPLRLALRRQPCPLSAFRHILSHPAAARQLARAHPSALVAAPARSVGDRLTGDHSLEYAEDEQAICLLRSKAMSLRICKSAGKLRQIGVLVGL